MRRCARVRAGEKRRGAALLPRHQRDLERLIDNEMRAAGLTLARDARALLVGLIGGDRAASRNEIRKLVLYAQGRGEVGVDDVTAVVSDASALALDDLVDTAFAGRPAELEAQLAKARAAGSAVGSIFFAAQRQLAQLHRWRSAIEDGAPFSLDAVQPPLHFRRKGLVELALRQWSAARLTTAMAELADAVSPRASARRSPK